MSLLHKVLKNVGPLVPDSLVGKTAREYFNRTFPSLGAMTSLQIDSANRRVSLELELKGEAQPIRISIGQYELSSSGGKTFITLHDINASREWMNALARDFVVGKKFEVPEFLRSVL